jgi:aspartyl aminopeptidase
MNAGVVIKTNAKQRYTSNAQTTFLLRCIAKKAGVPIQEFEIRNDSVRWNRLRHRTWLMIMGWIQTCGSTVGPHLSTHVRTVDIGIVQLSMHSIRETCGSADVQSYIRLFKAYFEGFSEINKNLQVD